MLAKVGASISSILELLARGEIESKGVMPPESCVPPAAILQPLAESRLVDLVERIEPTNSLDIA
jgi:saccharopine dehydrogenase-like NADP-dependent oxidoreductase